MSKVFWHTATNSPLARRTRRSSRARSSLASLPRAARCM